MSPIWASKIVQHWTPNGECSQWCGNSTQFTSIPIWLVVSIPLNNISQLGWLFPIYGKIKVMFQTTNRFSGKQIFGTSVGTSVHSSRTAQPSCKPDQALRITNLGARIDQPCPQCHAISKDLYLQNNYPSGKPSDTCNNHLFLLAKTHYFYGHFQ